MRRLRVIGTVFAAVAALVLGPPIGAAAVTTSTTQTYIVLYKDGASSSGAQALVGAAGGTLVANYSQIGVVIARSNRSDFRDSLMKDSQVQGAAATTKFASKLDEGNLDSTQGAATTVTTAAPTSDSLSGLQWDMNQIQAPEAHAITGGSSSVLVGDLDTGLDFTHPDLAPNVSFANSASCESGVADTTPSAWMDHNGHGTHTAGTIAAAANGIGIVGVAPDVRIAGVKTGNDEGFFFPEAVVCAFVWAGDHHFTVTNNSYFADPWYFNCKNDPEQRAIWTAERRAISYAMKQGVMVVSAMGNFDDDLAHPTQDVISPDTGPGTTRTVHNDCAVIPVEVPGVIGVGATGDLSMMSFYSNYGVGVTTVAAPGGDSILQRTAAAPNGRVLSTYPASLIGTCARPVIDVSGATYCYLQGTSMASPHVVGVVALIASTGVSSSGRIQSILEQSATPIACPTPEQLALYAPFPSTANGAPVACQGGIGHNSWYGSGEVNALNAVS